ncbi:Small-conductance mechanosensitive channel [archaeon HR06]|nr:Small-conductance mechanosensitive channel [archaeon HR06]
MIDTLTTIISSLVIIALTFIVAYSLKTLLRKALKRTAPLVATHISRIVWIFVVLTGIIVALEQIGLRLDLILLLIALVGGALVLANKDVLQNLASKYFSDVYVPFKVGDTIKVREYFGKVIEINPLCTILLTEKEELISIPNVYFLREVVVNITPKAWKEIVIPMVIENDIDLAEFESEVIKSCSKLKGQLDERFPPVLTIKNRGSNFTEILLTLMIKEPNKKDLIVSEVNSMISEIMDKMKKK